MNNHPTWYKTIEKKLRKLLVDPWLYLAGRLDTFPQAEVQDEDYHDQAQNQLPARPAQVLDTTTFMKIQHTPSAKDDK